MVVDFRRAQSDHSPLHRRIRCGDRQEHQIPWCASSGELHLVTQHHLHHQESPVAPLLPAETEESPSTSPHPDHVLQIYHRVLSSCITAWFGNCTISDCKTLQQIVRTAEKIIGVSLPSITDMYTTRCICKANSIVDDPSHTLFTLFPSGKSTDLGRPAQATLGQAEVIEGLDQGLKDMCVGEKREVIVPPHFGHGQNEGSLVPADAVLIFELELLDLRKGVPKGFLFVWLEETPDPLFSYMDLNQDGEVPLEENIKFRIINNFISNPFFVHTLAFPSL
ncbi:hypothetical protein QTP70_011217 [Hemibagrus guttatus]|uniref:peptidylprolyl isomerase n=1 Tax=Hemibagrus guttatus TaxID=175788 RepID=A0AAE0UNW2_9TELE|nr:hypothetical protein QTP70_011217 [Hemibagrus guttatus]